MAKTAACHWTLIFDFWPAAQHKEEVHERNSHNRADSSSAINSVGDGRAVEFYFASDARWGLFYVTQSAKTNNNNITNLYYSFISFPQMTFSVYPQCHHWAHQQGVVHGGWWHSSSDRRETLHPQNEPAGRWRPSQSYHDPTDGAEADHERSETIWNYFVALR